MSWKPYLRCQKCRELKKRDEFPDKAGNASGKRGTCLVCDPPPPPKAKKPSPPKWLRFAMCSKKHRYGTQGRALAAATRSARRTDLMRVYECPICKGWHLTHKEARAS